jgi:hypothetical protein
MQSEKPLQVSFELDMLKRTRSTNRKRGTSTLTKARRRKKKKGKRKSKNQRRELFVLDVELFILTGNFI